MEVHDFLPSRVRMFTRPAADGSWELGSQAADEALDVEIAGADPVRVAELKQAGEDGPLFRYLFLAQCAELSGCLPGVFQPVDECMALLLPANLMDPDGVIGRMVGDIDEADWADVQVLGWMYQYYNSEVKDAFFASRAKEAPDTIGPATQLFTPDWIVRYMVQNSLGRLWMLNNPASPLREEMEYYIEPDEAHEDFIQISGPEDISLCDPACGSGHILVYAFELLAKMYLERGYREREIPGLVLSRNLHGMEIDPRAAQIARLALAMCARGLDRRFFGRGVQADIAVLAPVALGEGDVPQGSALAKRRDLLDALAHLDEAGSLLAPGEGDLAAIREAIDLTGDGGLFGSSSRERLQRALETCETLARRHDCVVANPPYMGSSSFGPFMSGWVKRSYPDVKSDLCTCFIERGFSLAKDRGYEAMITASSWMFISSFEAMRKRIVSDKKICSLIQQSTHGYAGVTVPTCMFVIESGDTRSKVGSYIRLFDFDRPKLQQPKALEAIRNPDCGWFYRRDAETFKQIPGTPIAYWASDALLAAFSKGLKLSECLIAKQGMKTADNDTFLRQWFEVSRSKESCWSLSPDRAKWVPYLKGGEFRKWFGNNSYVINWENDGEKLKSFPKAVLRNIKYSFRENLTWSVISSGCPAFRYTPRGFMFDGTGSCLFDNGSKSGPFVQGFLNSNIGRHFATLMSPTLTFEIGQISNYPIIPDGIQSPNVEELVLSNRGLAERDWDSFETSWNFKRHPLL